MVLVINEEEVDELADFPSIIEKMEEALKELSRGQFMMPVRVRLSPPDSYGTLRIMPAVLLDSKVLGLKVLAGTASHRRSMENYFVVLLHDYQDGALKCIISANRLTQLRTGAISAVATKYLSRKDLRTFGLIGAGVQGKAQLDALCSVFKFEKVFILDISKISAEKLAEYGSSKFGIGFEILESIDNLLKKSDVISTATISSVPILHESNVPKGVHINAIGSNLPARKELDPDILTKAKLVVDSSDQAIEESGDLEQIKEGKLPRSTIYAELSEIVGGSKLGRTEYSEITIFKSVGIAVQDVVTANLIYQRALKKGIGIEVKL